VGPALQDFRVSNTKPPYTTTPEFQKVKGCRTTTSGFRVSGFRGFKCQTTIHINSGIPKGERMWDHHFMISGFGFQDFRVSNTKPQYTTNFKFQQVKGCGTTTSRFLVSGFRDFGVSNTKPQYATIPEFSKGERVWDQHFRISGFRISGFQMPNHNTHKLSNTER
jgi:hypothetical protein